MLYYVMFYVILASCKLAPWRAKSSNNNPSIDGLSDAQSNQNESRTIVSGRDKLIVTDPEKINKRLQSTSNPDLIKNGSLEIELVKKIHAFEMNPSLLLSVEAIDRQGGELSYLWQQTKGPTVPIKTPNKSSVEFSPMPISDHTELNFSITVTSTSGSSISDTVHVFLTAVQARPVGQLIRNVANQFATSKLQANDFDDDGDIDFLSGWGAILKNDGLLNFHPQIVSAKNLAGETVSPKGDRVAGKDIDGDGDTDYLGGPYAPGTDNAMGWYRQNMPNGYTFIGLPPLIKPNGIVLSPLQYAIEDIDGDGDQDLFFAGSSATGFNCAWAENDGNLNFQYHFICDDRPELGTLSSFQIEDLDNNGRKEIILSSRNSGFIFILKNDGTNNFEISSLNQNALNVIYEIKAFDIDGDGFKDIFYASANELSWFQNDGNYNFSRQSIALAIGGSQVYRVSSIAAGDIDGDGDTDFVIAIEQNDILQIGVFALVNDGNNNFASDLVTRNLQDPQDISLMDLDKDGNLDIFLASRSGMVSYFKNTSSGEFIEANPVFSPFPKDYYTVNYAAGNIDLIQSFGADWPSYDNHWLNSGWKQTNRCHSCFDGLRYIASYGDLINAFGLDELAGARHFVQNGFFENRMATKFDCQAYHLANPDISSNIFQSCEALTKHYIEFGFSEGRPVK